MAFASGKKAWGISDRSGKRYRLSEMKKEWNGLLVGPDEWEEKHPQLFPPRVGPDPQALKDARPDREEPKVEVLLRANPLFSSGAGTSVITVIEPGHGRNTSNVVRLRNAAPFDGFTVPVLNDTNGYSITVVDSDTYTITVSETAQSGQVRGGGDFTSAGPVTVEA